MRPLLAVDGLTKHFPLRGGLLNRTQAVVHAVDDVSFQVEAGETLGIVGESGCGKSTTGRAIVQLPRPTSGSVTFDGQDLTKLKGERLRATRVKLQMIFQEPRLVILDEAVSALDKSIEAQVLNLLIDLKGRFDLTYVFISHDLNVVRFISNRVMVMYLGKVVEIGPVDPIYRKPKHPYTRALLSAMPSMDPSRRTMEAPLSGDPPNPINPPSGCRFRTRCWKAQQICAEEEPALIDRGHGHPSACHFAEVIKPLETTAA